MKLATLLLPLVGAPCLASAASKGLLVSHLVWVLRFVLVTSPKASCLHLHHMHAP